MIKHEFIYLERKVKRWKYWFARRYKKCVCNCGWESYWYLDRDIVDFEGLSLYIAHISNPDKGIPQVGQINI